MNVGITIGGNNFNAICYAGLQCLITGLQCLIYEANEYIQSHGLRFNPPKTECMICGPNPFSCDPKWTIGSVPLNVVPSMKYLGTNLHSASHLETRKKCSSACFLLPPKSSSEIWRCVSRNCFRCLSDSCSKCFIIWL